MVAAKHPEPIDALVLCAGKVSGTHRNTVDGQEETLQVNVLSHALLIDLLAPKLGAGSSSCRILLVGSSLHRRVPPRTITPETVDTALTREFDSMAVYQITKLLQIFLLYMAQERFAAETPNVSVVVVSPGFIPDTGLSRELGTAKHAFMHYVMPRAPFSTTIADGGRNICRGITQNFASGSYFSQRKIEETAEECYDMELREEWRQWFVAKWVWAPRPETIPQSQQQSQSEGFDAERVITNIEPGLGPSEDAVEANVPEEVA